MSSICAQAGKIATMRQTTKRKDALVHEYFQHDRFLRDFALTSQAEQQSRCRTGAAPTSIICTADLTGPASRYVVYAAATPRMAFCNASGCQPTAFEATMFAECFKRVGAAGRVIPAIMPNPRAENQSVAFHRKCEKAGKRRHDALPCKTLSARARSCCNCWKGREAVTSRRPIST